MITLEQMVERVAQGMADSCSLREWCLQHCGSAPHVNVLYDPDEESQLAYSPLLVVAPGEARGAGVDSGASLSVDVWCRLQHPLADTSLGAAGTPLRIYKAADRLIGLARQALLAVDADLDGTNAPIDRHTIDRFDLVDQWPIVQCALRIIFDIPAVFGAEIELEDA